MPWLNQNEKFSTFWTYFLKADENGVGLRNFSELYLVVIEPFQER